MNEFLYLYHLKPFTHYGYFKLLPWNKESWIIGSFPTSFHDWNSWYFFIFGSGWETMSDDLWGEVSWLLRKWEIPSLGASLFLVIKQIILIFLSPFLQLLITLHWRNITNNELRHPLSFPSQLTSSMSWLTLIVCMSVVLDLSLLRTLKKIAREEKSRFLILSCLDLQIFTLLTFFL